MVFLKKIYCLMVLFGTAWATYAHHSGRDTSTHFVASNTVLQPFYNLWTGNLGLHTAHHYKPGIHWAALAQVHADIEAKMPDDAFVEPGAPWRWIQATPKPTRRPQQAVAAVAPVAAAFDRPAPVPVAVVESSALHAP